MAMTVGQPGKGAIAEINVTPMADVIIVLLIIFMVMTPLFDRPVRLPDAANVVEQHGHRVEVVVQANGTVAADGHLLPSADALAELLALRALGSGPPSVLVQADRSLGYDEVAPVLAACRRAGVQQVALAAQPRPGGL